MTRRAMGDGSIHLQPTTGALGGRAGATDFGRHLMPGDRVLVGRHAYQTSMLEIRDPCADVHPVFGTVESLRDQADGSIEVSVRLDCDGRIHRFEAGELLPVD